jgi:hypothetical protein
MQGRDHGSNRWQRDGATTDHALRGARPRRRRGCIRGAGWRFGQAIRGTAAPIALVAIACVPANKGAPAVVAAELFTRCA